MPRDVADAVYSEQFAGLPAEVHRYIDQRMRDVLAGRERTADFESVTSGERAAIVAILKDTLPDFQWR